MLKNISHKKSNSIKFNSNLNFPQKYLISIRMESCENYEKQYEMKCNFRIEQPFVDCMAASLLGKYNELIKLEFQCINISAKSRVWKMF